MMMMQLKVQKGKEVRFIRSENADEKTCHLNSLPSFLLNTGNFLSTGLDGRWENISLITLHLCSQGGGKGNPLSTEILPYPFPKKVPRKIFLTPLPNKTNLLSKTALTPSPKTIIFTYPLPRGWSNAHMCIYASFLCLSIYTVVSLDNRVTTKWKSKADC